MAPWLAPGLDEGTYRTARRLVIAGCYEGASVGWRAAGAPRGSPHELQNLASRSFSCPQFEQIVSNQVPFLGEMNDLGYINHGYQVPLESFPAMPSRW